jgi:hypothetical protein
MNYTISTRQDLLMGGWENLYGRSGRRGIITRILIDRARTKSNRRGIIIVSGCDRFISFLYFLCYIIDGTGFGGGKHAGDF